MNSWFSSLSSSERISWVLAFGTGLGIVSGTFFLPGGDDLYRYYIPFENGCLDCGYVPYFAQWFLLPLHTLPEYPYAWPAWTIINIMGFLALAYVTGANPFLLMISFPMLGQMWLGQIDMLICLGLVIVLYARRPYVRGLGIMLTLIKPQLMFLPLLLLLLLEKPRSTVKLMIVPTLLLLLSIIIYGPTWPMDWISNAMHYLPIHVWRLASIDIWKFGLFLLPLPLLVKDPKQRLEAGLLVSALATPFFGVYSYVVFLLLNTKWWTTALSYAWIAAYFWHGETAIRFAWLLPLTMLIVMMYDLWVETRR